VIADKFVELHARNSGLRDEIVAERDVVPRTRCTRWTDRTNYGDFLRAGRSIKRA